MDISKLTPVPDDLAKLSNVVKNDVVTKTEYNKLVTKVDNIDTTRFVLKIKYDTDKSDLEKKIGDVDRKIPDTSGFVEKTDYSSKITKVEGKIPSISGLATNSALTAVENKIPNASNLVTKTGYNRKISEIENKDNDHNHDKYITTTPEFNTLAASVFNTRLGQADLVIKTDFGTKLQDISKRIISNKSKYFLVKTEFKKVEKFDAYYFRSKNYFDVDCTQNYLVFQPVYRYFERVGNKISSWESKGFSNEKFSSMTTTSNNKFATSLIYGNAMIKVKFTYNHGQIVNIYIVYRLKKLYFRKLSIWCS